MFNFLQLGLEKIRLLELRESFATAEKLSMTECNKCGFCCHKRTCIPTPDEIVKIAEYLKIEPIVLINTYYAIDTQNDGIYYVKPIGINQKDLIGKFIPAERTFNEGKCIFLDENNLCKIFPVRPESAKIQKCWETEMENYNGIKTWKDDQLLKRFHISISF